MSQPDPQQRADRIRAFRAELAALQNDGVLVLPEDSARHVRDHHDAVLERLAAEFDVDTSEGGKQLSWGMRIVALLGAMALCASIFFVFYRYWGPLPPALQIAIVIALPLLLVAATEFAARHERTLYFAGILGLMAFGAFVLNLSAMGSIFNIPSSPRAFLPWGGFAFLLAYVYGLRILQVAGILCVGGWLAATVGTWSGLYWLSFGERPENFLPAGLVFIALSFAPHGRSPGFPPLYRIFGLLGIFLPILVLANWGDISYLVAPAATIEHWYQNGSFVVAGVAIAAGLRARLPEVTNLGAVFFTVFLYTKLFDWWWDWMPKYLFFLILGLIAVALLLVLRRLRRQGLGSAA